MGGCKYRVQITNEQANFRWKFLTNDSSRTYELGYTSNSEYPFEKGTLGWPSSANFSVYKWLEFTPEQYTAGVKIMDEDGNEFAVTNSGYLVYIEYPANGGNKADGTAAGYNQTYLECEGEMSLLGSCPCV